MGAGQDLAKAHDEALQDAQRRAVEQVVGVYVKASTLVKDAALVESTIYTKASGFIAGYKVVSEEKEKEDTDTVFKIKIRADVWVRNIVETLANNCDELTVGGEASASRILIALSGNAAESAVTNLQEKLTDPEFGDVIILDGSQLQGDVQPLIAKIQSGTALNSREINQLSEQVDLIISGSASVGEPTSAGAGGLLSASATLNLRSIWTGNGRVAASAAVTEPGPGFSKEKSVSKAVERAVATWSDKTFCKIKLALINPGRGYEIKVIPAPNTSLSIARVQKLADDLKSLRFTQEDRLRSFDAKGSWIDTVYSGTASELVRQLPALGAKVTNLTARTITVAITSPSH